MTAEQITPLANAAYDLMPALEDAEAKADPAAADKALRAFLRSVLPLFSLGAFERLHVEAAVAETGNTARAAELLGCSRSHVYSVLRRDA